MTTISAHNGHSTIAASNGYLYYNYLKDVYFWQDARGYFAWKDDHKWYVTAINGSDRRSENKAQLINLRELRLQFLKGINREASRRNGQFAALLDFNGQIVLKSFCCIIYKLHKDPNMAEEKKVVTLDDFEQRLMVSGLMDFRNDLLRDEKPTEDINDLILKAIDAPTKKEKRRADREAR